jgi:signal transduction histidine kinase
VFLNVVTNAIEAAGPGGVVEVQLAAGPNGQAVIAVFDSGTGPPPDVAARLFEPFVTGKREGVGLGLAVARQIVDAHGGTIRWHREGERTCFEIALPLPATAGAAEAPPARIPVP